MFAHRTLSNTPFRISFVIRKKCHHDFDRNPQPVAGTKLSARSKAHAHASCFDWPPLQLRKMHLFEEMALNSRKWSPKEPARPVSFFAARITRGPFALTARICPRH